MYKLINKIFGAAAGVGLLIVPGGLMAQPGSLFSDPKADGVGDALTVIIQESSSATNRTQTSTEKLNQTDIGSTVNQSAGNILDFIPLHSLQSNVSNSYDGRGQTSRSAKLVARMTVTVVGKKANGDLLVEGVRTLKVNGETEAIHLSGSVNPALVTRQNTILSSNIGDLYIEYTGKRTITQGARPGILARLLNWIF